jgi:hypothetical protein
MDVPNVTRREYQLVSRPAKAKSIFTFR